MEALDNNILGTNKIPGSEKFTRPEEIKALSKYLGNIRKTQDDHTKLGEESLALYGRKTGKLVDIKKLEDHQFLDTISDDSQFELVKGARPILENEGEDVVDLLQKKIELVESENEGSNINKLGDRVEKISDTLDIEKLPTRSVELTPDEAPEDWTKKLLKDVIKLQGNKDITDLPTDKVELDTPNRTIPLSEKKEELDVDNKVQSLRPHQKLEELNDDRSTPLSDKRENLVDDREIKLDSTIDPLNVRENVELSEYKDKISDERSIELSDKREDLEVKGDTTLSDYIDTIEVTDIKNLPEGQVELKAEEKVTSLPDQSDKLNVEENPELSNHIETIEDKRDSSLSDYREGIEVTDVDSLSDKKIRIKDDREVELPNDKLEIKDENEVKKLPNSSIDILSNYNYGLEVSKLSDIKENLKDSTTKSPEELSTSRLDISDDRKIELGKKKISPSGDIEEPELSEEQIQILEGKNREPETLDEKRVKLEVEDLIENLSDSRENLNLENEPEINELNQFVDSLDINTYQPLDFHVEKLEAKEKVDKLEDGIFIIDNDTRPPINKLPDKSLGIKSNENKSTIKSQFDSYVDNESFKKAVDEVIHSKELDNTGLFNRIMKLLQDIKKDSTTAIGSKEWVEKTEALVTTYFNTDNKEFLDINDDEFIDSWINYITIKAPENDKRQFDPMKSQVQAISSEGDSAVDNFFSFLLKANSVEELSQLLNLYKSKVANLKVPEIDKFKDKEIIPDTIQVLQELIKERGGRVNVSVPQNENTFDSGSKYIFTSADGSEEFDFIGALINTSDLETFKQLLAAHNSEGGKFKQRLGIKDINDNFNWTEYLTHTLYRHRRGEIDSGTWKMLGQRYYITDDYDYNGKRPLHNVRDANGNWVASESDPLTDDEGNVDISKFNSHKSIQKRADYRLPDSAQWNPEGGGGVKSKLVTDDGGVNIFGMANILSNPGANLNLNKYLRWTAEKLTDTVYGVYGKAVDKLNKLNTSMKGVKAGDLAGQVITQYTGISTNKRRMLEETLGMLVYLRDLLERSTDSNRDRLPGSSLFSQLSAAALNRGSKGVGDRLLGMAKAVISKGNGKSIGTRNRPNANGVGSLGVGIFGSKAGNSGPSSYNTETVAFEDNTRGRLLEPWKDIESKFIEAHYGFTPGIVDLSSRFALPGIKTTLKELAGYDVAEKKPVESLEELKKILINAPYITTPKKFSACRFGYKTQSLSNNSFWEIKLEPFVHNNMNGGFSYLPSIREINVTNLRNHGIYTGYNEWLPIVSFELERAKLATKSLGIYEGEIVYPVGCEFLNELSITMINDSLKSWSGYWRRVMEVATHNSEPHPASFYKDPYPIPTAIDLTAPVIALYKNVTWRCQIFILSPQYSTVRKFDLLVVLKDYTESYTGEIDSPGGDVQLRFSVVGENPPEEQPLMSSKAKTDRDSELLLQKRRQAAKDKGFTDEDFDNSINNKTTVEEEAEKRKKKEEETDKPKDKDQEENPENPPTGNKKPPTNKGNTRTTNTGNGYYARKVVQEEFAVERSVGYEIQTVTKYYMEYRTGDPSQDPDALMFFFDEKGELSEIHTFEEMDELGKSVQTWGGANTGYTNVYEGEKVFKHEVDLYDYWFGDNKKNANIPGLVDYSVADDKGNRNEKLVSQTIGIGGKVMDNKVIVREAGKGYMM